MTGRKGEEWIDLESQIGGFWALDAWSDREYCAVFDTKEEAEREKDWIIREVPDFEGSVFVSPTARCCGKEVNGSTFRHKG